VRSLKVSAALRRFDLLRRSRKAANTVTIPRRPPTEAPAIAPFEIVARATAGCRIDVGLFVGTEAEAETEGLQSGVPTATRSCALEAWACQSVISSLSLSTSIYAEVKKGRPRTSMSFALTSCRLPMRTSRVLVPLSIDPSPEALKSYWGTMSWWLGIRMSRPGAIEIVRSPSYLSSYQ